MQRHLDITAGLRMSYHPVCFSLLDGLLIKPFSPSPPMPLWLHGKYVVSILSYPCFLSILVVAAHRVIIDTLRPQFSLLSGSTHPFSTIPHSEFNNHVLVTEILVAKTEISGPAKFLI